MSRKKTELLMVLRGIELVRKRWLRVVRAVAREMREDYPGLTPAQAFNRALTSTQAHEEFMKTMALYGVIGADCQAFIAALEEEQPTGRVIPIRRKAA